LQILRSPNVGTVTFFNLMARYGSTGAALADLPDIASRGGNKKFRPTEAKEAEKEIKATQAIGADFIVYGAPEYPEYLLHLYDPPPLLVAKGNLQLLGRKKPMVAIVGSRSASAAGRQITRHIAREIANAGYVIVSGLARGIDTEAHNAAISGGTVGVSAVGIDQIYPHENTELYNKMYDAGCIITEQPFATTPNARLFPTRNRIIAGMAITTIVVEASMKSGSLITARLANEYGREVFAVPGSPLDPRSQGTNHLIKNGANMAENADDVIAYLNNLPLELRSAEPKVAFTAQTVITEDNSGKIRQKLEEVLSFTPVSVDDLAKACDCSPQILLPALLELELAGRISRTPGHKLALAA
jgi:DNA processing protein